MRDTANDRGPNGEGASVATRETFLASARAPLLCAREFDSLSDHIAARIAAGVSAAEVPPAEVRRAPDRCIVQLGPVALTVSWVRGRADVVLGGRLMVIQWLGVVGRGGTKIPERAATAPHPSLTATVLSESIYTVDATSERDWHWRDEVPPQERFRSAELAEHCMAALRKSLARVEGR